VVFNLVRNAIDALARDGAITLRVRNRGDNVDLEVEDNGPGIPGDPQRVFHPFHTTKPTGTGLGLTIARRIAVDHGGELRVESTPGRTVFTLSLPARR
jgi:signal transduction histidine kinase